MDDPEKQRSAVVQELMSGLRPRLAGSAVALFDIQTHEAASGTLVQIAEKLLVATAGHAIPTNPCGRIAVLGGNPKDLREGILGVIRSGRLTHSRRGIP